MAKLSTTSVFGDLLVDGMIHGNVTGNLTGNASTATSATTATTAGKWTTARTITIGSKGKSVDGSGNVSWTLAEIGAAASNHKHGLLHDNLTCTLENTATDNGWSMINSSYNGFLLKSIRTNASAPSWICGDYSAGIAFGGADTKGVISTTYNSPSIRFAGGNGAKPVWWINLTGTSGTSYNLANFENKNHGTHVTYATAVPKANGTAAVGSVNRVAREDHVHPLQTSVSGNAGTATKLQTARKITIGNASQNFDGSGNVSFTLSSIGAAAIADGVQTWNAVVKCATWSRILKHTGTTTVGGSYLINLKATRGNVVYNPTFIVNFSHPSKCFITQINNTDYSNIQVRAVVDSGNGSGYFEVYDNVNSATNATSQTVNVTVLRLSRDTAFEKYTAFTDGTTIPSGYTEKSKFTTVSGSYYSGKAATAANAEVLQTARNIQIGNKTNSFNGSRNISYTLADIGALPTAGGTMTGNIKFSDVTSTTYPAKSAMLTWNGSTDGADIYYQVDASDKGRLVLNTRDDADCIIAFANKGTIVSTIDNSGNFSGKASKAGNADTATKLATARNIKIGNATKSFNGTANIEFTLAEIGIGSSISAVASNLSGVTINGYDSMMTTINSNLGNL